ncbi:hypothetical protein D3C80_1042360 [compost metagenome]
MRVDTAKITAPQGYTMAIEKLEDFDRDLSTVVDPVPEESGNEFPMFRHGRQLAHDPHHFRRGFAGEEVVVADLVYTTEPGTKFQHTPYLALFDADQFDKIAHARRAETVFTGQIRQNFGIECFFLLPQLRHMGGQA